MLRGVILLSSLLFFAPACKTKHRATEARRTETELVATQHSEAVQLYGRAAEAVRRLTESDSLHIVIKDYRADGSLARTTEINQGRKREQTDSTKSQDSLQAVQQSESQLKANEVTTETRKVSTEAKPSLGIPWWLWVGIIVSLSCVTVLCVKKK